MNKLNEFLKCESCNNDMVWLEISGRTCLKCDLEK